MIISVSDGQCSDLECSQHCYVQEVWDFEDQKAQQQSMLQVELGLEDTHSPPLWQDTHSPPLSASFFWEAKPHESQQLQQEG